MKRNVSAVVDLQKDTLLSRTAAAKLLGRSEKTLRQWVTMGTGPRFLKFGTSQQSRTCYRRSDLEAWVLKSSHAVGGDE